MKSNTKSIEDIKIGNNLNIKITEFKPKKIPKVKFKIGDVVRYL